MLTENKINQIKLTIKDFHDLSGDIIEEVKLKENKEYILENGILKSQEGFSKALADIVTSIILAGYCIKILPKNKASFTMYVDTALGGFRQRL